MQEPKKMIAVVDGEQVFTADYMWQQQMAQSRQIVRAQALGKIAIGISAFSVVIQILQIVFQ